MALIPGPWKQLQTLLTLRGNHMNDQVEKANKWAYFIQNIGWILAIPVFATMLYSNMSNRIDQQEKEIQALRQQVVDNSTSTSERLDKIDHQMQEQMQVLTEVKTLVEGAPHGQFKPTTASN